MFVKRKIAKIHKFGTKVDADVYVKKKNVIKMKLGTLKNVIKFLKSIIFRSIFIFIGRCEICACR